MAAHGSIRRVLVYRVGSLGDILVSLPCLHLVARQFPNAKRVLLTNFPDSGKASAASTVLGDSGLIHSYLRYTVGTRSPLELARLWARLVRFRPQVLIYLMPVPLGGERDVRRNEAFFRVAGIRDFVGLPYGDLMVAKYDADNDLYEPESHRLARAIRSLGDARIEDHESWSLRLTSKEHEVAASKLQAFGTRPFIACSIGTKAQAKDWTLPNWSALFARLTKERPGWGLLLMGAPDERAASSQLANVWEGQTLNVCGELTPRESAAAIKRAKFFIGHDSGPMHIAASVKTPSVSIYSAKALPGIWFPFGKNNQVIYHRVDCMGCDLFTCIEQKKKCIMSITVDEVMDAINKLKPNDNNENS